MDIGSKIKAARVAAQLTQEQVAEALGVTRQTLSNWENGKTYPDIVSVIKMSDLYGVSLDHLLKGKEEPPMSEYIEYLEESTNTVKSQHRLSLTILMATYLGIWAFALIVFWFFISGSDAMAYALIFLWIVLPVATLVTSWLVGRQNYWGKWKWLSPLGFGLMHMLAEYGTFSMANMVTIGFSRINPPAWELIAISGVISLVGLSLGSGMRWIKNRK